MTAIYLGRALPRVSCGLPGAATRLKRSARGSSSESPPRRATCQPLLVLAPGGVCRAAVSPRRRCALTAPFHPCLCLPAFAFGPSAVYFLLHFPWGRPPRLLAGALPCGVPTFLRHLCLRPSVLLRFLFNVNAASRLCQKRDCQPPYVPELGFASSGTSQVYLGGDMLLRNRAVSSGLAVQI